MIDVGFLFKSGQVVRHRMTGEEGNVVARDASWYSGNAYRLRFVDSQYMSTTWYQEDELVEVRPPYSGPKPDREFVEDMAEFNSGAPDPYEDSPGG